MKKSIVILLFICMNTILVPSCKKSSTSENSQSCTTNACNLTSSEWKINTNIIYTDSGTYTLTSDKLSNIPWATFSFQNGNTYADHVQTGTYLYDGSSSLALTPQSSSLTYNFNVIFPTKDSLRLSGPKIQIHPMTDSSAAAIDEANNIGNELQIVFGVDLSTIHSIQPVYNYGK